MFAFNCCIFPQFDRVQSGFMRYFTSSVKVFYLHFHWIKSVKTCIFFWALFFCGSNTGKYGPEKTPICLLLIFRSFTVRMTVIMLDMINKNYSNNAFSKKKFFRPTK